MTSQACEDAKAIVRRNTEEVQGKGDFALFETLFADTFVDHTPQPGMSADKDGVRLLYKGLRAAFPDLHAEIGWQSVEDDRVTTYKTYHGTHLGAFFGMAPTGRTISFEAVDAMRVQNGDDHRSLGRWEPLLIGPADQGRGGAGDRLSSRRTQPEDFTSSTG